MYRLRTLNLPPHRDREFFLTVFVEPDPGQFDSFSVADDADEWGMSVHFQPDTPYESHVEVARIDTTHGEPHFDRLYESDQPKEWLGRDYTYEDDRADLLSNWRTYADQFLRNHYSENPDRSNRAQPARSGWESATRYVDGNNRSRTSRVIEAQTRVAS